MPPTRIQDVIVPEIFAAYVSNRTKELSSIVQSGIATSNAVLDELVTNGGSMINMPFWNDLIGDDEVLSETVALTPQKITAGQDKAAMLIRGKAWAANELAGALAGSDPMAEIGNKVAAWWVRQEQKALLSVLKGVFLAPTMSEHIHDQSSKIIDAKIVLDAKQRLGDAANMLTAIAMHSAVYTELQKQNLISSIPASQGSVDIPTYLGYRVVVDDSAPLTGGVYTTYLFANGVIGRGVGTPKTLTPVEVDRDSLQSDDILINRRAFTLHPFGVKWKNSSVAGATPTNDELAMAANWERIYEPKQIGIVALKHKI